MSKKTKASGTGISIDEDWQAQSDAETLIRAKEIQLDKKRYARAMAVCRTRCKALTNVMED